MPFLEQAGIQERSAQRMMRYVRLIGEVEDIQALPSMNSILEKDREKHEQDLGMAIQTIFEGVLLVADVFKSQVDKGDKLAATKLGGLILRDIQPWFNKWIEAKDWKVKCDSLTHLAEGVLEALEYANGNLYCVDHE